MMKKTLLLLAVFTVGCACLQAKPTSQPAKYDYLVLRPNSTGVDTISQNVINLDSAQIAYFNRFVKSETKYYEADSLLSQEIDSLRSEMQAFKTEVGQGNYDNTKLWVRVTLFALALVLVLLVVYLIIWIRGLRNEVVEIVTSSNRIKEWYEKSTSNSLHGTSRNAYDGDALNSLQRENRVLKDKVRQLEDAIKDIQTKSVLQTPLESAPQSGWHQESRPAETQRLLYADSIIDGQFSHVRPSPDNDTFFVLKLKNDEAATIDLYSGAFEKILANTSYIDGCDKQVVGGSNSIVVNREGEALREGNGKWKVLVPLKVVIG